MCIVLFIARNMISYTCIRNNTLLPGMESVCERDCRNLHVLIQLKDSISVLSEDKILNSFRRELIL